MPTCSSHSNNNTKIDVVARRVDHYRRRLGSRSPNHNGDMSDDGDHGEDVAITQATGGAGVATGDGLRITVVSDMLLPGFQQCDEGTVFKVAGLTLVSEGVMHSCDASGRDQLVPVFSWRQVGVETEAFAEDKEAVKTLFAPGGAANASVHKRIQTLLPARGVGARDGDGVLMMSCLGVQYVLSDHAVDWGQHAH